jgi:glycosyltransferase involved in cell wall biosynthesis
MYKAPDIVLKALKIIIQQGVLCKLVWLGDGVYKTEMEELAKKLNISDHIKFKGNVSKNDVEKYLQNADIFILVSRTEGLPRAMIEAMATGLPCIGSAVGGIPELLSPEVIIKKNNPNALAKKLNDLISNKSFYNEQSEINLQESKKFVESILSKKRNEFYTYLKNLNS